MTENFIITFLLSETFGFWFKFTAFVVLFTLVSVLVIAFFSGVGNKDFREKRGKLIILLLISHTLAVAGIQVLGPKKWFSEAACQAEVCNLQTNRLGNGEYLVEFKTDKKVLAYLEYQDLKDGSISQAFPVVGLEKTKNHSFVIPALGEKGAKVWFVIYGEKHFVDGQPLILGE